MGGVRTGASPARKDERACDSAWRCALARPHSASTLIPARQTAPVGRHRDALAPRLPVLRAELEQQRRFRREQLALLDANGGTQESSVPADPADNRDQEAVEARREVDGLVAAGARQALADIDLALVRMDTGRYGLCRSCGARIPLIVLEAIPKTTLCLTCQPRSEGSDDQPSPAASRSKPARGRRKVTSGQRQRRRTVDTIAGRANRTGRTR
jgi:DnaK suppressor protein